MIITSVNTTVLRATLDEAFAYSQAWYNTRHALIVEIGTDEGLIGIGECFGPPEPIAAVINHVYKERIIGRNPLDNEVIWEDLYNSLRDHGQKGIPIEALSGIDIALLDIKGKMANLPLYQLLGGAFRTKVQAYATGFYRRSSSLNLDHLRMEAEQHLETGFKAMKVKIGFGFEDDASIIRELRRVVGDEIRLMADANHAYDARTAIQIGCILEEQNYYWFEEPVPPEDLDGYDRLHQALNIPIAAGEAEFTRFGAKSLIKQCLIDIIQPDCCATGGITEARRIALMANAANIRCIPHVWGTQIARAAALHLIATLPPTPFSLSPEEPMLELDTSYHPFRDLGLLRSLQPHDGYVSLPSGPGLGIMPDWDNVNQYRIG